MFRFVLALIILFFPLKSTILASNNKIPSLRELCIGSLADNYSKHTPQLIRNEEHLYLSPQNVLEDIFVKATDPGKLKMLDISIKKNSKIEKKEFLRIKRKFRNLLESYTFCLLNPDALTKLNSDLLTRMEIKNSNVFDLCSIFEKLSHPMENLTSLRITYAHTETSHHPYKTQSLSISSKIFPNLINLYLISTEVKNTLQPFLKFEFTDLKKLEALTLENVVVGESYNNLPQLSPQLFFFKLKNARYIKNLSEIKQDFKCALDGDIPQTSPLAMAQLLPKMPNKMTIFLDGYFFYPSFFQHLKNLKIQHLRLRGHAYSDLDYSSITSIKDLQSLKILISEALLENIPFPNNQELNVPKQSFSLDTIGESLEDLHIERPITFVGNFSSLKNIIKLNLNHQILPQSQMIQLFSLLKLQRLTLETISFEKDVEETFKLEEPSHIQELSLSSNNHEEILPFITRTFKLPLLKRLNLAYPNTECASEIFSNYLCTLLKDNSMIESLNLLDIQLNFQDITFLSTHKTLKELKIKGTTKPIAYTAEDLKPLEKLGDLESLWVTFKSSPLPETNEITTIDLTNFRFLLELEKLKNFSICNLTETFQKNEAFNAFEKIILKRKK